MPTESDHDLLRLDGGIHEGTKPTHIQDNEGQNIRNFYPFGPSLRRRKGVTRVTSVAFSENLTSLFAYRPANAAWKLICGGLTQFGKLDGTGIAALPFVGRSAYTSSTKPWKMVQLKDIVYAARVDAGTVQRIDGAVVMDAGIPAPTSAPTTVEGAAGALAAGAYIYVITFLNSATGAESDFGTKSTSLTITADKKIDLTAIPVSSNGQVNARNIYRTEADQTGEYFFVAQLTDNTTTTYTDNVKDEDLDTRASLDNGLPPGSLIFCEAWAERLWVMNKETVFFSRAGLPESMSADFSIPILVNDGHVLRGMAAQADRLIVGKTNKMHYIRGDDESNFGRHTLSDRHGLFAGHSLVVVEGVAFWFGGTDFFLNDGTKTLSIGNPFVRDTIDAMTDAEKEILVSWVFEELNWYCTAAPTSGLILVANYKTQTWTIFEHGSLGAPVYCTTVADADFGTIMYAVFADGFLYQWHSGIDDNGQAITCKFRGKEFGFGSEGYLKAMSRIMILSPAVNETLTARIYRDEKTAAEKTRSVDLSGARKWKHVPVSNLRAMGSTVSLELEYSGNSEFQLDALKFKVSSVRRMPRHV